MNDEKLEGESSSIGAHRRVIEASRYCEIRQCQEILKKPKTKEQTKYHGRTIPSRASRLPSFPLSLSVEGRRKTFLQPGIFSPDSLFLSCPFFTPLSCPFVSPVLLIYSYRLAASALSTLHASVVIPDS